MSLKLVVSANGAKKSFRLDPIESDAVIKDSEGQPDLESALEVLFDVPDFGEPAERSCGLYRQAITTALGAIKTTGVTVYSLYSLFHPDLNLWSSCSSMGGVRINGELYHLTGGVDQCIMEHYVEIEGKWEKTSTNDIRHLKSVQTDTWGEVKIKKRKRPGVMMKTLRDVDKFLANVPPDDKISIMIA